MDDYKRTLYMQALTELHRLKNKNITNYLCIILRNQLLNEQVKSWPTNVYGLCQEVIPLFFKEFDNLFDETFWYKAGDLYYVKKAQPWWQSDWIEPRIRALECILRD